MVSQSHASDFPPISTVEEQTHQENLPNTESPHHNPSEQSDHSNICESSSNLPISNETPIGSRADVHQVSPIISAGGINVTTNTQEIQSTIQHHKTHTLLVSSPLLHAPTPGLNNFNQEVDFQTQNPPTFEETQQSAISQPASPPNFEFSIFSNEFCPQFYKIFQMFNSGQPTQAKYQTTFEAINSLVEWRLQSLGFEKPAQGNFDFNQCSSSYTKWIDELSDHSSPFLNATKAGFYVSPQIFNMQIYDDITSPEPSISIPFSLEPHICNEKHPETIFVRHLIYMAQPCHFTIISWEKLIAASISATMDGFCIPKPPMTAPTTPGKVHAYLDMLTHFEGLK
ncbi:hypothetical protein O181_120037 [Austropuccinia psidii MF-1]|uniref:Uncharacterized protein n=1 Tax=Austropuccinia psidii MF-1 TaxID=1389203 RepID=A0A9Q3KIF7_9BASI|nr:hypothetical protein [Austropuccinia psidii MF-1]